MYESWADSYAAHLPPDRPRDQSRAVSPRSKRRPPDDEPSFAAAFGERFRALREHRALTQEALADKAGVSVHTISALERGVRMPRIDVFEAVCRALGLLPSRVVDVALPLSENVPAAWRRSPAAGALRDLLAGESEDTRRLVLQLARVVVRSTGR